eukprot:8130097-Karenia_brevis.AAC.1
MAGLIKGTIVHNQDSTSVTLKSRSRSVADRRWLEDSNITDIFSTFRKPDGSALPEAVLALTP